MDKRQILKVIVAQSQAGAWPAAAEACRDAARRFPEDAKLGALLASLEARSLASVPPPPAVAAPEALEPSPAQGEPSGTSTQAFFDEAVRRRIDRESAGADSLSALMQNSRRISDVLHAAATRHMDEDVEALLSAARTCLGQGLLPEAMRLCQKITALEPDNEQVKGLLKEIYRLKGL